jgi:hypothetical protein
MVCFALLYFVLFIQCWWLNPEPHTCWTACPLSTSPAPLLSWSCQGYHPLSFIWLIPVLLVSSLCEEDLGTWVDHMLLSQKCDVAVIKVLEIHAMLGFYMATLPVYKLLMPHGLPHNWTVTLEEGWRSKLGCIRQAHVPKIITRKITETGKFWRILFCPFPKSSESLYISNPSASSVFPCVHYIPSLIQDLTLENLSSLSYNINFFFSTEYCSSTSKQTHLSLDLNLPSWCHPSFSPSCLKKVLPRNIYPLSLVFTKAHFNQLHPPFHWKCFFHAH